MIERPLGYKVRDFWIVSLALVGFFNGLVDINIYDYRNQNILADGLYVDSLETAKPKSLGKKSKQSSEESKVCPSSTFLDETDISFDYENGVAKLNFPNLPYLEGVDKLTISFSGDYLNSEYVGSDLLDRGFYQYNSLTIDLSTQYSNQEVPIKFFFTKESQQNKEYLSRVANVVITTYKAATGGSYSLEKRKCQEKQLTTVDMYAFNDLSLPRPYFKPKILYPFLVLEKEISSFNEELKYLADLKINLSFFVANKSLPKPNVEAFALLLNEYDYDNETWDTTNYARKIYIDQFSGPIVFGLFGYPDENDFSTLGDIIVTLRILAPQISIAYSTDPLKVTIPIHFSPCNETTQNSGFQCSNWVGVFTGGGAKETGWIWIDTNASSFSREATLYHEIGHALGLPHNKCYSSSMSYELDQHWTDLDLMMLNVLYNPTGWDIHTKKFSQSYWERKIITTYNFDQEKLEELKRKPWDSCLKREIGWDVSQYFMDQKSQ